MSQPTFNDSSGREYRPVIDYDRLRVIRNATGFDLGDVSHLGEVWAKLIYNDERCLEVIWLAIGGKPFDAGLVRRLIAWCGQFFSPPGITYRKWLGRMHGGLLENARDALGEAILNFTPPQKRGVLEQGMGRIQKEYENAIAEAEASMETLMTEAVERYKAHGNSAPAAPESSDTSTITGR